MGEKTRELISFINRFFRTNHKYSDELMESGTAALEYSIKSGESVLGQFYGFNEFRGKVVLDYGCGNGGKTLYYSTRDPKRCIGVDLELNSGLAREYARKTNLSTEFMVLSELGSIGLGDSSVDIVIGSSVLEHVSEPGCALREINRVLKDGGLFLNRWHPFRTRYGSHIKDGIGIPFAHLIFKEEDLIPGYCRELVRKYGRIPSFFKRLDPESRRYADLDFSLNFCTVKKMRKFIQQAGFRILARRYFWGRNEHNFPNFIPESIRDYFIDYEVQVWQKEAAEK